MLRGLCDVDLDCAEAIALAEDLLPETNAVFGRHSKPESHRLYTTELYDTEQRAVIKYSEPRALAGDGAEAVTLVELRIGSGDKGAQTIFPVQPIQAAKRCGGTVRVSRKR
jgi:hypothetical protein